MLDPVPLDTLKPILMQGHGLKTVTEHWQGHGLKTMTESPPPPVVSQKLPFQHLSLDLTVPSVLALHLAPRPPGHL